ncbi:hypothetical protein N7527_003971 [Penicillium freii]|nr:hypothetical protein N7527_003971 [Penicillium freii]
MLTRTGDFISQSCFKHKADHEKDERPIPTPTGDELETLTQLRLRAARRDRVRELALQEAYDILGYLQANMGATTILCRSDSGVLTLLRVEGRIGQVHGY